MTRSRGWLRTAVLSFLLLPAIRVEADIPPPPDSPETKRVPVTIELDWGVFADRVSRKHVVVAGDTLRSLAEKHLGDKAKWKAIVEANPAIAADPDHILAGATLWIPPVRFGETPPAAAKPESGETAPLSPWYDAFWQSSTHRGPPRLEARATPGEMPAAQSGGGVLVFIPHAEAGPFVAAATATAGAPPESLPESALYAPLHGDSLVNKDDPTVRVVTKFKLTGVTNRLVTVEPERLRYDAAGALVTRTWDVPVPDEKYREAPGSAPAAPPPLPAGMTESVPVAPPGPLPPPPVDTPPVPAFAPPSMSEPSAPPAPAPAPAPAAEGTPSGGGGGKSKPPLSPLVIVIASLVALALIGVVVLLRRGAGSTVAATPPSAPPSSPPPPPTSSAPPPFPGTSSAPDRFPPGSPPPVV